MKFVRRSEWGAPVSAAAYIAGTKGSKVHYLGTPFSIRSHDRCADYVRSIRASHLANTAENYSDIAYNMLVCEHGYVYEGRGAHKRTGANGNATLNGQHYAVCALLGSSGLTEPTDDMLHGIRDAIEYLRDHGNAGSEIKGHRDGYATSCPGDPLYAWVQAGAPRPKAPTPQQPPAPAPSEEDTVPTVITESVSGGPELAAGTYRLLHMAADSAILQGPCVYAVTCYVRIEAAPGTRATMRFHDLLLSAPTDPAHDLPMDAGTVGPDGVLSVAVSRNGRLEENEQLKVELKTDKPAKVTHRVLRGLRWTA